MLAALLTAFNARSATASVVRGLFANRWLWAATLLAVALQVAVVHLPQLQTAFGTAALDATHWGVCLAMASLIVWVEEARKAIVRLADDRTGPRWRLHERRVKARPAPADELR